MLLSLLKRVTAALAVIALFAGVAVGSDVFDLDGTSDGFRLDNINQPATSAYSFCAWVYLDSIGGSSVLIAGYGRGTSASSGAGWQIGILSDRRIQVRTMISATGVTARQTDSATVPLDTWTHVCYTRGGTLDHNYYINGAAVAGGADMGAPVSQPSTDDFWIGADFPNDSAGWGDIVGRLAHVAYWKTKLTAAEIEDIYDGTSCPTDVQSASLAVFVPGTTDPAVDEGPNGFTVNEIGDPAFPVSGPTGLTCFGAPSPTPTPTPTPTPSPTPTPAPTPVPPSYLTEEICGDGIDNDNSAGLGWGYSITAHAVGDQLCTGLADNDQDGFDAANDCDDTNRNIFPSEYTYWTTGCSGGQVRKCQADGTWSACAAWSCPGLNCYYFDPVNGSNSNTGTLASPWKDLDRISQGCTGNCRTPTAGDVYVLRSGVFEKTNTSQVYVNSKSGTALNPIVMMAYPGETPIIDNAGTSEVFVMEFVASNYWHIEGLTFRDNYGDGIQIDDGDNWIVRRNLCESHRGGTGSNRNCFKSSSGSSNNEFSNNIFFDSGGIIFFTGTGNRVHHNVAFGNNSEWSRSFAAYKHGAAGSAFEADQNIVFNIFAGSPFGQPGIWTATGAHIHNNLFHTMGNQAVVVQGDPGGPAFLVDIEINNNTIINTQNAIAVENLDDVGIDDDSGPIDIHDNIVVDDSANYTGNGTGLIVVDTSGNNAAFTHWVTGNRLLFTDSCYYNGSLTALTGAFELFSGGESSGATYDYAGWTGTAGYDTGGSNSNPNLAAGTFLPSGICTTAGRLLSSPPSAGGSKKNMPLLGVGG